MGLLLAFSLLAGCGGGERKRPNIVVLVLDTVRLDYLSAYGYDRPTTPFLEDFATQGTRFERAYSTSSWTLPSHGSLFTGTMPKTHRAHQSELEVATTLPLLAERLWEVGYQTAGLSGNVWISPRSGLHRGFEFFRNYAGTYRQKNEQKAADRQGTGISVDDHETIQDLRYWIANERNEERPFFLFVNLVEPHLPYLPPWQNAQHFLGSNQERWQAVQHFYPQATGAKLLKRHYMREEPLAEGEWATLTRMYEGVLRTADDLARAITEAVDGCSDPENTLFFILSDHGENIGDHGHFTHIFNIYDSNLRIPLFARGPGFPAGEVRKDLVQILDLYPTILSAAGLAVGEQAIGLDLRGQSPEDRLLLASLEYPKVSLGIFSKTGKVEPLVPYMTELRAAVSGRTKLIVKGTGEEEIFDVLEDPGEENPLDPAAVDPALLDRMRRAIVNAIGEPAPTVRGQKTDWDTAEGLKAIREMGYGGEE